MTRQVRKTTIQIGNRLFLDQAKADEWERILDVTEMHVQVTYPRMRDPAAIAARVRMIADGIETYAAIDEERKKASDAESPEPTTTTTEED